MTKIMFRFCFFGMIESCRFPRNSMVMKVHGGILVFGDDQILQTSKKHYGDEGGWNLGILGRPNLADFQGTLW